jgi:predicted amidohydrolase YtcJ
VARKSRYTKEIIAPGERLSRRQAIEAATINGAWLTFDEQKKGSLEAGKLADLAVVDADPLTCEEDALRTIAADLTMVGGKVVYEKGAGENPAADLAGL